MDIFNSCIPIPVECDTKINNVAFDGCDYYCTISCKCEIIKFNPCKSCLQKYTTCREYDSICYDYGDHCFWASSKSCLNKLYKLDCDLKEIDSVNICESEQYGCITSISYNCCKNTLIISYSSTLIEFEKYCEKVNVLCTTQESVIIDVLSICPGMLITVLKDNKYYIKALNQCGEIVACYSVESNYTPKNLIFNPCITDCHKAQICAFILKCDGSPYLCKCNICVDEIGFTLCNCNYTICKSCCCEDKHCNDNQSFTDIIESIALVETALSHILNAEGEKIQKVLSLTDDIDKIICVNREVNRTLVNATQLEQTLYSKLIAIMDCGLCNNMCDNICEEHCNDKCECKNCSCKKCCYDD